MRILHTVLRVGDLQRSIDFYTCLPGMKLLRTSDNPEYQYTLAFVGYGNNPEHAELELTYNYGVDHYELGTVTACAQARANGGLNENSARKDAVSMCC